MIERWDNIVSLGAKKVEAFQSLKELPRQEYRAARHQGISMGKKVAIPGAVVLFPLIGAGLGAIVDGTINHFRAKKADKSANA